MNEDHNIKRALFILLVTSAVIRGFVAGFIEFGYDEVYYWTYALYPSLSHFDHPPMLGWMIQVFTLDLWLDHEFFIRLAAVVFGTVNTWVIFKIGSLIKDPRAGLYAAFLYTTSFYAFLICGIFIMPDGPQSLFWLLTLWFLLRSLPDSTCSRSSRTFLFVAGITAGLALLSKYHSIFLLSGAFMYILLYNRKWFTIKETWYAFLLVILIFLPVILWNLDNDFISFTFHGARTSTEGDVWLHPEFLFVELLGQFLYNNPVNVVVIIMAFFALSRGKKFLKPEYTRLILWISLPLVATFLLFALFARTLPHWTGPAYFGFILIAASWLSERSKTRYRWKLFPKPIVGSSVLLLTLLILAVGQIRFGWIPLSKWGARDFTHDMYGWKQLGEKFAPIAEFDRELLLIDSLAPIFTYRWFPAANFDYYIGRKTGNRVYALGTLDRIHKYHWINQERGNIPIGMDVYYIALSDDYEDPQTLYGDLFTIIQPSDTILIMRGNELVRKAFVYRMIGLKDDMEFVPSDSEEEINPEIERLLLFQRQIRTSPEWIHILRKKAKEGKVSIEVMIIQEAQKMLEREKEVKRDIRLLDSIQKNVVIPQTLKVDR
ncbi:MAG: glycosyltransferase family 39 protein [Bacteroidales bacterium]|nr:glycosyltransferase family 39 protein [Bacteroidales bacterium]